MLYGVHVYARANGYPDLALERGRDAHGAARALGDRFLEFLAACGLALSWSLAAGAPCARSWASSSLRAVHSGDFVKRATML